MPFGCVFHRLINQSLVSKVKMINFRNLGLVVCHYGWNPKILSQNYENFSGWKWKKLVHSRIKNCTYLSHVFANLQDENGSSFLDTIW